MSSGNHLQTLFIADLRSTVVIPNPASAGEESVLPSKFRLLAVLELQSLQIATTLECCACDWRPFQKLALRFIVSSLFSSGESYAYGNQAGSPSQELRSEPGKRSRSKVPARGREGGNRVGSHHGTRRSQTRRPRRHRSHARHHG